MLKAIEKGLAAINNPIARAGEYVGGFFLVIMTSIVLLQVFFRYILNSPISWTDEASRFLMIYMTYLALPVIYLTGKNIAMTFVLDAVEGTRIGHLLKAIIHVIALVLFAVWIKFGWVFFGTGSVTADSLPIPMYVIYIAPPALLAITCLAALQKLVGELDQFIHFNTNNKSENA
ncbi:TRAP transporter small permease [Pseudovibrio sp. SCP19]|uniref:TRAP transporter small permease n=1 Tax=Pseudovibrio sp. SCP19 TaxID=3141374 RepID=UPI00333CAC72